MNSAEIEGGEATDRDKICGKFFKDKITKCCDFGTKLSLDLAS